MKKIILSGLIAGSMSVLFTGCLGGAVVKNSVIPQKNKMSSTEAAKFLTKNSHNCKFNVATVSYSDYDSLRKKWWSKQVDFSSFKYSVTEFQEKDESKPSTYRLEILAKMIREEDGKKVNFRCHMKYNDYKFDKNKMYLSAFTKDRKAVQNYVNAISAFGIKYDKKELR